MGPRMCLIEADKGAIIITGPTVADVYEASQDILRRCGEVFISFTTPVKQADGQVVSRGNVVIGELT